MATELILIRHGESEGNIDISSDPDCKLTNRGIEQAHLLGGRIAKLDLSGFAALASPYTRAQHTAAEIGKSTGLSFGTEELIREWGDIAAIKGRQYYKETTDELIARLKEFLRVYAGRKVVVVSHAAPIAVLTQLAWSEKPNIDGQFWNGVNNCCLRWLRATHE